MQKKITKIDVMEPSLSNIEKNYLIKTFNQNYISVFGSIVNKVKSRIIQLTKCSNLTLTNSGSSALIIGLKSLHLNENDLVITSNYTFIATINSIIHAKLKPWLFDIEKNNFSIDLNNLEKILIKNTYKKKNFIYHKKTNQRVSAIMPVIFCGIVPDLKRIKLISKKYNLKIIIDCAGGFIQLIDNKDLIKFSDIVITSFNGNKSITSGSGGAIFSNKKKYFKKFDSLSNNSKIGQYLYDDFGFNAKMTNLHAAILMGQLDRIRFIINKKKIISKFYRENLNSKKFKLIVSKEIMWINLIELEKYRDRNKLLNYLKKSNIFLGEFWVTMNNQKKIKNKMMFTPCPISNSLSKKILVLPSSISLKQKELLKIKNLLNKFD